MPTKTTRKVAKTQAPVKKRATSVSATKKGGKKVDTQKRNPDGTFKKGNKPIVTKNYGRPPKTWCFRQIAKWYAEQVDEKTKQTHVEKAVKALFREAEYGDIMAIDRLIRVLGHFDPQENKITGEVETKIKDDRPLKDLDVAALRKLLGDGDE